MGVFGEWLPALIWYSVEFTTYLCIIAYTLFTFNIIGPFRLKKDVPATFDKTWSDTNKVISVAANFADKFSKVMDNVSPERKKKE